MINSSAVALISLSMQELINDVTVVLVNGLTDFGARVLSREVFAQHNQLQQLFPIPRII